MKTAIKSTEQSDRHWLKIGEVSKRSGVGIETLRFYEKVGLLGRPSRTESGYRLYDAEAIERLEFIKRAQALGFSLAEIARIIAEKQAGHSPCREVRQIVRGRLKELDQRIKEMRRYQKELQSALDEWEKAGDREGHVCGLIESANIAHSMPGSPMLKRKKR